MKHLTIMTMVLVLTACAQTPVKQAEPKPKSRIPLMAVIVERGGFDEYIFKYKDQCYLMQTLRVTNTWCPWK